jgi:hypothetical protein
MTQQNYQAMSDEKLRDYVRYHPEDVTAFHALMDRLAERPGVLCITDEEIEAELRKRVNQES